MGVRGAFGKLRQLIAGARDIAAGKLEAAEGRMMQECKAALAETVAESFLYQRTPDGKSWAARITVYGDFRDTNPILFDLLSYMQYEVRDGKVIATNTKPYAFYHLTAYKRRPARVFLPSSTAPGKLTDRLKLAAIKAVRGSIGAGGGISRAGGITMPSGSFRGGMPSVGGGGTNAGAADAGITDAQSDDTEKHQRSGAR